MKSAAILPLTVFLLELGLANPLKRTDAISEPNLFVRTLDTRYNGDTNINAAGAIIYDTPKAQTFESATGMFTMPNLTYPAKGSAQGNYSMAFIVALDGEVSTAADLGGLAVGIEVGIGATQYMTPFWFWIGSDPETIPSFPINPADEISLGVHRRSSTSGLITIDNHSTGQSTIKEVDIPTGRDSQIEGRSVSWTVRPTWNNDFPAFGSVNFTECSAKTSDGQGYDLAIAQSDGLAPSENILRVYYYTGALEIDSEIVSESQVNIWDVR